jgi:hypothetical protein
MTSLDLSFLFSIFFDFTSYARIHETHPIVKTFLLETGRTQVGARPADGLFLFRIGASKLASRTDVEASPTQSADLGVEIEGGAEVPLLSPTAKANGLGCHLLLTNPNASSAEDAVFIFLPETLLTDVIG